LAAGERVLQHAEVHVPVRPHRGRGSAVLGQPGRGRRRLGVHQRHPGGRGQDGAVQRDQVAGAGPGGAVGGGDGDVDGGPVRAEGGGAVLHDLVDAGVVGGRGGGDERGVTGRVDAGDAALQVADRRRVDDLVAE